jgi:mRNA interferase RelE/StbE
LAWTIEFDEAAAKEFRELDWAAQKLLRIGLRDRLIGRGDPRSLGRPLTGNLQGLCRYRIGDDRLVAGPNTTRWSS